MQSQKTHDQQMRIIEKRVKTANAGPDFDLEADLTRSQAAKRAFQKGRDIQAGPPIAGEDRDLARGQNQEGKHHKGSGKAH